MTPERGTAPVCPYCGYVDKDALEIDFGPGFEGDTVHTCDVCDLNYFLSRYVSVSYVSRPLARIAVGNQPLEAGDSILGEQK